MTNPLPHHSADRFWITAFALRDLERMMSFVWHHVGNHWQALHDHVSVPVDVTMGQALTGPTPIGGAVPTSNIRKKFMILLTTPTGDIGHRVLSLLLDAGASVRVIARDASKLSSDTRVHVVQGSMADADTIAQALPGVTRVFWLPPGDPTLPSAEAAYCGISQAFCDALPNSGVKHVVSISALGRGWPKPAGLVTATLQVDDMIARTGVHLRALTCASLMDNIARQVAPVRATGMFYQPTPSDQKLPHVAKADVARIAADLLLDTDWTGVEELPLLGPENLSFGDMAAIMSDILGYEVRAVELTMDQFGQMMRRLGTSEGMSQAYVDMLTAKNEGMDNLVDHVSRHLTPTTFRDWCNREFRSLIKEV